MHGQQRAAGATRGPELRIELGKTSEITRADLVRQAKQMAEEAARQEGACQVK